MIYRLIAPDWALKDGAITQKVLEGEFTENQIAKYNKQGYNIYYLPNYPSSYNKGVTIDGSMVDTFNYVFVDCDLKDGVYKDKDSFLESLGQTGIEPTIVIDSGNGVHAYWQVSNLEAKSYLRFQRRLIRLLRTDEAVSQLFQLMRCPGTVNTKLKESPKICETIFSSDAVYTAEEFDKILPAITLADEQFCEQHYNKTYQINQDDTPISDKIPPKFGKLLRENPEAKTIWAGSTDDRSAGDFRLGHLMFANAFTKEEAASVLINSAKALTRAPIHRRSYAMNIIDKIWTFENEEEKDTLELSSSVKEILQRKGTTLKGERFPCHPIIDSTEHGFRLGQVLGIVGGSGIGKTSTTLNMFMWFAERNPEYHHFFVPLEQPDREIADRWKTMCGADTRLHDKVHILSNYDEHGSFRALSLDMIKEYIEKFQKNRNVKVGCVVIDHIGALKKEGKDGENQDLMDICHAMKSFAVQTNTFLVMQSQSSREKAGIGDLELNKDAAYGTVYFESYCDYLITLWQPLKRCHSEEGCPLVTAFKFCKIRHKKARRDVIQEDVCYYVAFDSDTEQLRDLSQDEKISFAYFLPKATNKRRADRKTEVLTYQSVPYKQEDVASNSKN